MSWIAGVDGCRGGWFLALRNRLSGELRFAVVESARLLVEAAPKPAILALDIPIGLPAAGARACELEARRRLSPLRTSSVFPAPVRPALDAGTYAEAAARNEAADGRKISKQTWALFPKIREVDSLLRSSADARERICEIHPELCFWAWNGNQPMAAAKKTPAGRDARLVLAERWLGADLLRRARQDYRKKHVGDDDILDAVAALWTAERIANGRSTVIPASPPLDACGLPMRMTY